MRIIVPIKQVPETKSVKMDEKTGTVIREGVESIINPLDLYAIEAAILLSERLGWETLAISMGPAKAGEALREAIAMGIGSGVLLSDKAFAGSDTWATAYVLAEAIKKVGEYSLVICGERATDGDTGQVGPEIAAFLGFPVVSYVNKIEDVTSASCSVSRLVEDGAEQLEMTLPGVITVVKEVSVPRLPTLRGKQRAKKAQIPVWGLAELPLKSGMVGLSGSPTRVGRIFRPKIARECERLVATDEERMMNALDRVCSLMRQKLRGAQA